MEIKGMISQLPLYRVEQNGGTKVLKDMLKGIRPSIDDEHVSSKSDKEKNFSKLSPKEDIYDLNCRSVAKDISDLNVPLSDTGTGMGGGSGGG